METLVVQLGVKHGRVAELARSRDGRLSIGRGFDNDLVLTDPHVAPNQVEFRRIGNQWQASVLDQTNPVLLNGEPIATGSPVIKSGDRITVGRTNLSLYSADHPVEHTRKLVLSGWLHRHSKGLAVPFVMLVLVCLFDAVMDFLQVSTDLKWKEYAANALTAGVSLIFWAGLWSLVGRLIRHQPHFGLQLMATSLVSLLVVVITPLQGYLEYLTNSVTIGEVAGYIVGFISLMALLRLNLMYATHVKNTIAVSVSVSLLIMAVFAGFASLQDQDTFNSRPQYSNVLKPPFAQFGARYSVDSYLRDLENEVRLLDRRD